MGKGRLELADYIVLIIKYKKKLILISLITLIISYLAIYFFVEKKYDSTALIIPSQDESISGITSLLEDFKGFPIDIPGVSSNSDIDMYNTIVYSRGFLEDVIEKFNLVKVYNLDTSDVEYLEDAIEILKDNISAEENVNMAYEITVRANSPNLAANLTNYIVKNLNERIIRLKINKSHNNRVFLENRVKDVRINLRNAEDSLKLFQEKTEVFEAENQAKASIEMYLKLDAQLAEKQIEQAIYEEIYGTSSPQAVNSRIVVDKFKSRVKELKNGNNGKALLMSIDNLPDNVTQYYRYFRNIEIYNKILEFILPLYEQARFQEQKDIPVLQVVDYAVPPAKKSFPPRTIFTLIITFGVAILSFFIILIKENENWNNSQKYRYIKENIFKWTPK